VRAEEARNEQAPAEAPSVPNSVEAGIDTPVTEPNPASEPPEELPPAVAESIPKPKPARTRRKSAPPDAQMNLFGEPAASVPVSEIPAAIQAPPDAEPLPLSTEPTIDAETPSDGSAEASHRALEKSAALEAQNTESTDGGPLGRPETSPDTFAEFAAGHAKTLENIRLRLEQGDWPAANQLAQRIKTDAREVDSVEIQSAAADLAKAISEQNDPDEIETIWTRLNEALRKVPGENPITPRTEVKTVRPRSPAPPVNPSVLRKAVGQILPLLSDSDPGAQECFQDHHDTFQSAFSHEGFDDFERAINTGDFVGALEQLRKAARKHGVNA